MYRELSNCRLCPRECKVNRNNGMTGVCGQTSVVKVARAALHFWEEPCISGEKGSGAVFFSGCNVGCVFCQNRRIAKEGFGVEVSVDKLSDIFMELEKQGANNINLVTPTHYVLQIRDAIILARKKGLRIPFVYNTSGYELVESLRLLEGLIDVYLPDCKYISEDLSGKYSFSGDYFRYAKEAIREMVRQTGPVVFDENGLIQRGVIVRHLLLPGHVREAKAVVSFLYEEFGDAVYISMMNQYTPFSYVAEHYPEINRKVTKREYEKLLEYAFSIGVTNGFMQEGDTASESFVPKFNGEGVLMEKHEKEP